MNRNHSAMRAMLGSVAAGLAFVAALPVAAQSTDDIEAGTEAAPATKGEVRLAKLLEDRVAGEPVHCIRTLPNYRMQTIDGTAYVYGSGNTIYVQRTSNPEQIDADDTLITNRFSASQLCKLDQTTTVDRVLGFFTGAVFFEDFVPYTRVKPDAQSDG
jgi:hypothetical protein